MDNKNQLNDKKLNEVNGGMQGFRAVKYVTEDAQAIFNQVDARGSITEEEKTALNKLLDEAKNTKKITNQYGLNFEANELNNLISKLNSYLNK